MICKITGPLLLREFIYSFDIYLLIFVVHMFLFIVPLNLLSYVMVIYAIF